MKLQIKLFLQGEQEALLGPGRIRLLSLIRELGSLRKAAESMGMSYRWAWEHIKKMQDSLGIALLERREGGRGRSWTLTSEAVALIHWFEEATATAEKALTPMYQTFPIGSNHTPE